MAESKGESTRPLPYGGLEVLTELITHQDSTTWTALSVFVAAEFLLVAMYVQALPSLDYYTTGTLGAFGLLITLVSFFVVERSERYLEAYLTLAKRRCDPKDLEIFEVNLKPFVLFKRKIRLPSTNRMIRYLHGIFALVWFALYLSYLLILAIRLSAGRL